jgi:oxaloacetate decarboxylase gamma subunit
MEDVNLIFESVKFMVLGMTVVFSFLTILIGVVHLQAKLIAKFFPEETPKASATTDDAHHVAAIIAAVTEFRKKS